jgi:uncharacterized protein
MSKQTKGTNHKLLAATLALAVSVPGVAVAAGDQPTTTTSQSGQPQGAEMVPLRTVAEAAGGTVEWNAATQTATIKRGDSTVMVKLGSDEATVDGQTVKLNQATSLIGGKTMVPLGFLNAALKIDATYDRETGKVNVLDRVALSSAFLNGIQQADAAKVGANYSKALAAAQPATVLNQTFAKWNAQFGGWKKHSVTGISSTAVHDNVSFFVQTERANLDVTVRFDKAGKIDDYFIALHTEAPAYVKPSYDDSKNYYENEVIIGEGVFATPGTLTLPKEGKGPYPVVILVHGSGPDDRDESVGALKPFRDVAVGLAQHGIASIRYEKRTHENSQKTLGIPNFTVKEETVDDAVEAVKVAKQIMSLDSKRIFVLGHSQGGMLTPTIIDQDSSSIAGAILMAGPNEIIDDMMHQNEYMVKIGMAPPQALETAKQQFDMLRDPNFNADQPPAGFVLGEPHYWKSFVVHPSEQVLKQSQPYLIVNGSADFQVPPSDQESWKKALAGRSNVEYKMYDNLIHMFVEHDATIQNPFLEFNKPQNVPGHVIDDIAKWVQAH